jgi:hypothetical protein
MDYITTEKVAEIRNALKERFPHCRFGCKRRDSRALSVSIMKSPYDFRPICKFDSRTEYAPINQYYIPRLTDQISEEAVAFLILVNETILNVGEHYDNSDPQVDHFDVAFYYDISVGRFDNGHVQIAAPCDLVNAYRINELSLDEAQAVTETV